MKWDDDRMRYWDRSSHYRFINAQGGLGGGSGEGQGSVGKKACAQTKHAMAHNAVGSFKVKEMEDNEKGAPEGDDSISRPDFGNGLGAGKPGGPEGTLSISVTSILFYACCSPSQGRILRQLRIGRIMSNC